jgi:hypothetical protein
VRAPDWHAQPPWYPWFEVPEDERLELEALRTARMELQRVAHTSRWWTRDPHLPGICGEWCHETISGVEMNRTSEIWHDHVGEDFPGLDVKATTWWRDPFLRVGDEQGMKAPIYMGMAVNLDSTPHMVKPLGYATRLMMKRAPLRQFGQGKPAHMLKPYQLVSADVFLARALEDGWRPDEDWIPRGWKP